MVKAYVAVSSAPELNFRQDYVCLPRNYGSTRYWQRQDIQAIQQVVRSNLDRLNQATGFLEQLQEKKVVLKPNLVSVYHDVGFVDRDYPNTTDPRVLDAIVEYLKPYAGEIVIAESSGRGMPTRGSFRLSGIHRLAKYRNIRLVALEEEPVVRYILPKAKVMQEVFIPQLFKDVVEGRAFYISVPKLKTNMYTTVTLGFKNGMGCIPYNLRQRNHNHDLDQKLVDMLWLFKPDLVIIDGVVGAQGQCPAPVEPVDSGVIISGDNSVETDRIATEIMGFDSTEVKLMQLADAQGFGCPKLEVLGSIPRYSFKPADPSLLNQGFSNLFPNVRVLIGHSHEHAPKLTDRPTPEFLNQLEMTCRGGCLATTRLGFEFLRFEGHDRNFHLTVILGGGCQGTWYDREGKSFSREEISSLPGKKLAVGNCARSTLGDSVSKIAGCMVFPNSVHMKLHGLTKTRCKIASPTAPAAPELMKSTMAMRWSRIRRLRRGQHLDWWPDIPQVEVSGTDDWIEVPLANLSRQQIRSRVRGEWREIGDLLFY